MPLRKFDFQIREMSERHVIFVPAIACPWTFLFFFVCACQKFKVLSPIIHWYRHSSSRYFGTQKNRVKGKPRYRRSILVLKPKNGEYSRPKSTFLLVFTSVKLQLQSLHLYLFLKVKKDLMLGFNLVPL